MTNMEANKMVTTESLALQRVDRQDMRLLPRSIEEAWALAERTSKAALVPAAFRDRPHDVFLVVQYGLELGVSPMTALLNIDVIDGKPRMNAQLTVGLVKASPLCKYFTLVETTASKATFETLRTGDPHPTRLTYTLDHAKQAGLLGKRNWQSDAEGMLRNRCAMRLARIVYPDVIGNMYDADEIEEMRDRAAIEVKGTVAPPAPPVAPPPAPKRGTPLPAAKPSAAAPAPAPAPPANGGVRAGHVVKDDWTSEPALASEPPPAPKPDAPPEPAPPPAAVADLMGEWEAKIKDAKTQEATMALWAQVPDALVDRLRPTFQVHRRMLMDMGLWPE